MATPPLSAAVFPVKLERSHTSDACSEATTTAPSAASLFCTRQRDSAKDADPAVKAMAPDPVAVLCDREVSLTTTSLLSA